MLNFKIVGDD